MRRSEHGAFARTGLATAALVVFSAGCEGPSLHITGRDILVAELEARVSRRRLDRSERTIWVRCEGVAGSARGHLGFWDDYEPTRGRLVGGRIRVSTERLSRPVGETPGGGSVGDAARVRSRAGFICVFAGIGYYRYEDPNLRDPRPSVESSWWLTVPYLPEVGAFWLLERGRWSARVDATMLPVFWAREANVKLEYRRSERAGVLVGWRFSAWDNGLFTWSFVYTGWTIGASMHF